MRAAYPARMLDVVVVRWPQDEAEVERLARDRVPRLMLVEPGTPHRAGGRLPPGRLTPDRSGPAATVYASSLWASTIRVSAMREEIPSLP